MNRQTERGFTLWELLVAVTVAGIVLGIGVPNMMEFQRNNAMAGAGNELVTATLLARAEAVKRQVPVTLCLSADWDAASPTCSQGAAANTTNLGFIVWVDENGNVDGDGSPILTDATDGNASFDAGETVLRRSPAPGGAIRLSADAGFVTYTASGFPARPFAGRTVVFCDERGNRASGVFSTARAVRIDATGRGQVLQEVADVTTAVGVAGADCP